jgi:Coenzyme PQQ synthesis protein D (PqqD)
MNELRLDSDKVEWREIDHEVIALEGERSTYLAVNRSGTLLWRALADGHTEEGLAQLLVAEYGLDVETARADAARFLGQVRRQGLLKRC